MAAEEGAASITERAERLRPALEGRLAEVRRRIELAGGEPDKLRIVAVTKTFGPEHALAAFGAGLTEIGENYAGELLEKAAALSAVAPSIAWHYLGAVQRNKIARLSKVVSCWQGVSRAVELEALSRRYASSAGEAGPELLVEVNVARAPARTGCEPEAVAGLVAQAAALGLRVRGLMAVAPLGGAEVARRAFDEVASLARGAGLEELSIGMSGDFELAVGAGATMLRLGTALFGPRAAKARR